MGKSMAGNEGVRLPAVYRPASWRCTTAAEGTQGRIGVGFTHEDGAVVRVALSAGDCRALVASLQNSLQGNGEPVRDLQGRQGVQARCPECGSSVTKQGRAALKVFKVDECTWWYAATEEEAVASYVRETGIEIDSEDYPVELTFKDLNALMFTDEDSGDKRTFYEELARLVDLGRVSGMFATTEF